MRMPATATCRLYAAIRAAHWNTPEFAELAAERIEYWLPLDQRWVHAWQRAIDQSPDEEADESEQLGSCGGMRKGRTYIRHRSANRIHRQQPSANGHVQVRATHPAGSPVARRIVRHYVQHRRYRQLQRRLELDYDPETLIELMQLRTELGGWARSLRPRSTEQFDVDIAAIGS
jgi:hypothetical protein